jgi:hypothetical protein
MERPKNSSTRAIHGYASFLIERGSEFGVGYEREARFNLFAFW